MRVLHLDTGREMRGGQWQVLRLIEGLEAEGVESTLLARPGGPLLAAARDLGWRAEPLGLTHAARFSRRHDLVHAHDARAHTLAAIVRGAPLVVSRRVAFAIGGGAPRPSVGSKWKYLRPAHYLAVSRFVKSVLVSGGVPAEKITVVYDGVPVLQPAEGAEVLAPANASDPEKGAALAVEAARVAGVPLKLSANLEHDLPHAGVFVYVTHSEGLGSGVLLAMSAGVPVVASNIGGLPEVVHHGENGLLVENTPEAVAEAIRALLDHPALARRLGAAGRATILDHFTVQHMVRRTMDIYSQVLA